MKEEIIITAADMFLAYGFKSVTMDDIAQKMGISKKTIYAHFSTKTKLVEASTVHVLRTMEEGIQKIREQKLDAIEELLKIKRFVLHHLKDEKSSPQFQLSKYYPRIFIELQENHLQTMHNCVRDNLEKGIIGGVYRPTLPVDFVSKIYFLGMMGIKDKSLFPEEEYPTPELTVKYLEYHLRAIVTKKGFEEMKKHLNIED